MNGLRCASETSEEQGARVIENKVGGEKQDDARDAVKSRFCPRLHPTASHRTGPTGSSGFAKPAEPTHCREKGLP